LNLIRKGKDEVLFINQPVLFVVLRRRNRAFPAAVLFSKSPSFKSPCFGQFKEESTGFLGWVLI